MEGSGRVVPVCLLLLAVYPQLLHSFSSCLDMAILGGISGLTHAPSVVDHLPRVPIIGHVRTLVRFLAGSYRVT